MSAATSDNGKCAYKVNLQCWTKRHGNDYAPKQASKVIIMASPAGLEPASNS